jgi:hypothetical protein
MRRSRLTLVAQHGPYPGQKATAGNLGFGIGGLTEIEAGPCAEFCVYHLMDLEPGEEKLSLLSRQHEPPPASLPFRHKTLTIGNAAPGAMQGGNDGTITVGHGDVKKAATVDYSVNVGPASLGAQPPAVLGDIAQVLRSKNAGPYDITLDAVFDTEAVYNAVKSTSDFLSPKRVGSALNVATEDIVWCDFFDAALAFKVTMPRIRDGRRKAAGGFMEDDMHGTQQHVGLYQLKLPESLIEQLGAMKDS